MIKTMSTLEELQQQIDDLTAQMIYKKSLENEKKSKEDRINDLLKVQSKWLPECSKTVLTEKFYNMLFDLLEDEGFCFGWDTECETENETDCDELDSMKKYKLTQEELEFIREHKPKEGRVTKHGAKGMRLRKRTGLWYFRDYSWLTKREVRESFGKGEKARKRCLEYAKGVWAKYPNISV